MANKTHDVEPEALLTMACNVLHKYMIAAPRVEAKRRYAELSAGRAVALVKIRMQDDSELTVGATLDSSEYRGKLNFSQFRKQLEALLQHLARRIQQGGDINLFNDESGRRLLFHLPLLIGAGEQLNALLLGVQFTAPGEAILELQYVDAEQYREQKTEGG